MTALAMASVTRLMNSLLGQMQGLGRRTIAHRNSGSKATTKELGSGPSVVAKNRPMADRTWVSILTDAGSVVWGLYLQEATENRLWSVLPNVAPFDGAH